MVELIITIIILLSLNKLRGKKNGFINIYISRTNYDKNNKK